MCVSHSPFPERLCVRVGFFSLKMKCTRVNFRSLLSFCKCFASWSDGVRLHVFIEGCYGVLCAGAQENTGTRECTESRRGHNKKSGHLSRLQRRLQNHLTSPSPRRATSLSPSPAGLPSRSEQKTPSEILPQLSQRHDATSQRAPVPTRTGSLAPASDSFTASAPVRNPAGVWNPAPDPARVHTPSSLPPTAPAPAAAARPDAQGRAS